jgi:hypothetical protein
MFLICSCHSRDGACDESDISWPCSSIFVKKLMKVTNEMYSLFQTRIWRETSLGDIPTINYILHLFFLFSSLFFSLHALHIFIHHKNKSRLSRLLYKISLLTKEKNMPRHVFKILSLRFFFSIIYIELCSADWRFSFSNTRTTFSLPSINYWITFRYKEVKKFKTNEKT